VASSWFFILQLPSEYLWGLRFSQNVDEDSVNLLASDRASHPRRTKSSLP